MGVGRGGEEVGVGRGGGDPGEIEGKDYTIELLTSVMKFEIVS